MRLVDSEWDCNSVGESSQVAELSDDQKVTKLQQQLLLLLSRQAKDLTSAYPQMTEDAAAKEAVFSIFTSEMQKLSTEVDLLSSAVCVPVCTAHYATEKPQGLLYQWKLKLSGCVLRRSAHADTTEADSWETPFVCLPHEVNHYLKQGSSTAKQGTEGASQEPLWRRFRMHCSTRTLLHDPEILSRERVHSFMLSTLWQYIGRGPEENLGSSFSAFLMEQLSGCGALISCCNL